MGSEEVQLELADSAGSTAFDGPELAQGGHDLGLDDADLDARWGLSDDEPLVGFGAPPVVAVMVTSNPGDWFEEALESLVDSDYENLEILVIDNASVDDPTERIAAVSPTTFVKRLESDSGFSDAANEAISAVEGAAFYLVLHDDVRLDRDAVTSLVAEAFRSNAGVVGPKIVDWYDERRLRSVGFGVDPYGFASAVAEPGELDQSQHDMATQVFAVSDACLLIRADLFDAIGGFNADIPFFGEDIDLCWRTHIAAASVHLCPEARVGHLEGFDQRRSVGNRGRLELRHQARTMLSNYSLLRLLWVVPTAIAMSLIDMAGSLVMGRFQRAGDIAAAWIWNLLHLPSLFAVRSRVKKSRRARDADYLPLMRQGSSRLRSLVRVEDGENRLQTLATTGRGYLREATLRSRSGALSLLLVTVVLMIFGARGLLLGPLASLREFVDVGRSGGRLLSEWFTGWREIGLGEPSVSPGVVPVMGGAGTLLFGSMGLARRLLILGPLLVGGIGAWKLFARSSSTAARAAALAAYGLNPVALNAIAEGRLQALVAYAAAPWLLRRVASAAGIEPFGRPAADPINTPRLLAGTALLLAAVGSVSPLGELLLVITTVVFALVVGIMGDRSSAAKMSMFTLVSAVLSLPVMAPWLFEAIRHGDASSLTGYWRGSTAMPSATKIITGSLGPISMGLLGWGLIIAASYALLAGRSWRLAWAVAGWITAVGFWALTSWLASEGLLAGGGAELFVVPAALGMTVALAMGVFAFEEDVLGSDFGLGQVLSGVAIAALACWIVPTALASTEGRWYQPEGDFDSVLHVVDEGADFRTVWLGDPDVLPVAGWPLAGEGLSVGVSTGLDPSMPERFHLDGGAGMATLTDALNAALAGETSRLGRLLAPMGVKYIVVVDRPAPEPYSPAAVPMAKDLTAALREQLDLRSVDVNPGVALFSSRETWPLRSDTTGLDLPSGGRSTLAQQLWLDVPTPEAVFGKGFGTKFSSKVPAGEQISQSVTADPGWKLDIDGKDAPRSTTLGWSQAFDTGGGGSATLKWATPLSSRLQQLVQVFSLIALVLVASRRGGGGLALQARRRERNTDTTRLVTIGPGGLTAPVKADGTVEPTESGGSMSEAPPIANESHDRSDGSDGSDEVDQGEVTEP